MRACTQHTCMHAHNTHAHNTHACMHTTHMHACTQHTCTQHTCMHAHNTHACTQHTCMHTTHMHACTQHTCMHAHMIFFKKSTMCYHYAGGSMPYRLCVKQGDPKRTNNHIRNNFIFGVFMFCVCVLSFIQKQFLASHAISILLTTSYRLCSICVVHCPPVLYSIKAFRIS